MRPYLLALIALLLATNHETCSAWWNKEWTNRAKVSVNVGAAGLTGPVAQAPVLVRLHTGNFPFVDAKPDGSDVRVVAADDKTPLKFHIEKWDGINELAFLWVQLPELPVGKTVDLFIYVGNAQGVGAEDSKGTWDAAQVGAFHFGESEPSPLDRSTSALTVAGMTAQKTSNALIGGGLSFDGKGGLTLNEAPGLAFTNGFTFSAWVKLTAAQTGALLFKQAAGGAPLEVGIDGLRLYAKSGVNSISANADLTPGAWKHIAVTVSDRIVLYVDGIEMGAAAANPGGSSGATEIATRFAGELDELLLANQARSADWIRFAAKSQAAGSQMVGVGTAETTEGGSTSYFGILLKAVTLDGWIVIGILMVMLVVSFVIMIGKAVLINRTEKANERFVGAFRKMGEDLTKLHVALTENPQHAAHASYAGSNLYRIYRVGMEELATRFKLYKDRGEKLLLSPQAIGAIRATMDAGLVKESHRLQSQMVLLTIAIAGGPFLGLLGTVVGVMITFAAIAAAGDVNVNSIAPGIAAALVATVAGLAVAIPALFGYNYLSSRIKSVVADMHVFSDELLTKLAEGYSN